MEFSFPLSFYELDDFDSIWYTYRSVSHNKNLVTIRRKDKHSYLSKTISFRQSKILETLQKMLDTGKKVPDFPVFLKNFKLEDGSNVFHFLMQDLRLLKKFHHNVVKFAAGLEEDEAIQEQFEIFILLLYPNLAGV